ncbi:MAG: N-acylneuraminate cytidylyltransferase [Chloroflexi bacterium]|nr:MAG: N-acylneuraminate cytidylyltransferase [Chloroflexota bacterium]
MVNKPEVLAIIPARGGSKGIPRKNIRDFAGYPLIAYSIRAGTQSQTVTRTIVSTDDEEIASVARVHGAETPFLRPDEFAQDTTTDLPVFQHALKWLAEHEGYRPDVVVQLRPTSPIRPLACLDDAVNILLSHPEADSVRGVVESGQNPYKMWRIDTISGHMSPLIGVEGIPEVYNAPRQKLPTVFWQTGHIDAIRPQAIIKKNSMSGSVVMPLVIDPRFTVDIDTEADWIQAEWLVKEGGLQMVDPAKLRRSFPSNAALLVMDFDGVLTDNRVWVNEKGEEMISANRSDSLGLALLREKKAIDCLVISKERNPVVEARCKKLRIPVLQAVDDKAAALRQVIRERSITANGVIYIGNDTNDLPCFPIVGFAVCPADAHPDVLRRADLVLNQTGGHGAVRELCDILLSRLQ